MQLLSCLFLGFFIFPVCAVHHCVHGNLTFLVVCIKQKQKTNTSVYHVRWGHQLGKLPKHFILPNVSDYHFNRRAVKYKVV